MTMFDASILAVSLAATIGCGIAVIVGLIVLMNKLRPRNRPPLPEPIEYDPDTEMQLAQLREGSMQDKRYHD